VRISLVFPQLQYLRDLSRNIDLIVSVSATFYINQRRVPESRMDPCRAPVHYSTPPRPECEDYRCLSVIYRVNVFCFLACAGKPHRGCLTCGLFLETPEPLFPFFFSCCGPESRQIVRDKCHDRSPPTRTTQDRPIEPVSEMSTSCFVYPRDLAIPRLSTPPCNHGAVGLVRRCLGNNTQHVHIAGYQPI
jgi:hypothetical protein